MDLPPLASVSDLETRLGVPVGSLTGDDLARARAALDDASRLVRAEARLTWVADDGETITAPPEIVTVVLRVARRQYANPDGYMGESIGRGAYSYQYGAEAASAYLTRGEIAIVRRAAGLPAVGVGSAMSVRTPSAYGGRGTPDGALVWTLDTPWGTS